MRVPHGVAWQPELFWVDCRLGLTLATDAWGEVCLVSSPDGVELGYAPLTPRQFRAVRRHLDLGGRLRCTVKDFQARLTEPWPVTIRIEPAEDLPRPWLRRLAVALGAAALAALAWALRL